MNEHILTIANRFVVEKCYIVIAPALFDRLEHSVSAEQMSWPVVRRSFFATPGISQAQCATGSVAWRDMNGYTNRYD